MPTEAEFLPGTQHIVIIPVTRQIFIEQLLHPGSVLRAENTEVIRQRPAPRAYSVRLLVFILIKLSAPCGWRPGPGLSPQCGTAVSNGWVKPTPLMATPVTPYLY